MLTEAQLKEAITTLQDLDERFDLMVGSISMQGSQWDLDTLVQASFYKGMLMGLEIAKGSRILVKEKLHKPTPRPRRRWGIF